MALKNSQKHHCSWQRRKIVRKLEINQSIRVRDPVDQPKCFRSLSPSGPHKADISARIDLASKRINPTCMDQTPGRYPEALHHS